MKTISIVLFLLSTCLIGNVPPGGSKPSVVVMAYYVPEKDYHPESIPVEKLTHIIYSFTHVIDGEMKFRSPGVAGAKLTLLVAQKSRNPNLKVMIACGGWGADGFSDMAHTVENRTKFVQSAKAFIETYHLDGLDIDWEYPGIPAAGTGARDEDLQNFTLLMKELREALNELDRPQTLTFASAGWEPYYDHIQVTEVMKYVDFMNIMTYDLVVGTSPYTGHHTALGWIKPADLEGSPLWAFVESKKEETAQQKHQWGPRSTEKIVDFCIKQGVNPRQIVIGAAFYGRAWKGVHPAENGLYQANGGVYIGWSAYHYIRNTFEPDPDFQRHWDKVAKAPYLFNQKDSIFISYDDTVSVKLKTQFAQENNLGGIMFWELSNDTKEDDGLLDAIYQAAITDTN